MRKEEKKRVKGRQSRRRKEEGVDEPSVSPPGRSSGDPDGEGPATPAGRSSASPRGRVTELGKWWKQIVTFITELAKWWKLITAVVAALVVVTGAILAALDVWVLKPRRCSQLVVPIREAMVYADWHSVSVQIPKWEEDCRGCSRELDVEVNLYKALSELWAGRISIAQKILASVRFAGDVSTALRSRADYVDTVLDRAAGRIYVARTNLQGLLAPERMKTLPDDVRFDALYDLSILETSLGDRSQADLRLTQIREAVGSDEMRRLRVELLTGLIDYARGQLAQAEQHLNGIVFPQRAPVREGLRLFYLSLCCEGVDAVATRVMRNRAKDLLSKAGNNWFLLDVFAHEVNVAIDALEQTADRSPDMQNLDKDIAAVSNSIKEARQLFSRSRPSTEGEASGTDDGPLDWIDLRLRLSEARVAILRLKLPSQNGEPQGEEVRRDLESVLQQAETQGLVLDLVWCHLARAQLALIEEEHRETADRYKRAVDLAEDSGLLYEAARARGKRAEYRRRSGDRDGCRQDIQDAIAIWKKLGNDTWVRRLNEYLDYPGCSIPARSGSDREPGPNSGDMGS